MGFSSFVSTDGGFFGTVLPEFHCPGIMVVTRRATASLHAANFLNAPVRFHFFLCTPFCACSQAVVQYCNVGYEASIG